MMKRFTNWLTRKISPKKASVDPKPGPKATRLRETGSQLRYTGRQQTPRPAAPKVAEPARQPEYVNLDPHVDGRIEDNGPGKNVLIRNKYVREDTGTHETLKILDDSMLESEDHGGIDPYNTGQFDRSKNWDKRRK